MGGVFSKKKSQMAYPPFPGGAAMAYPQPQAAAANLNYGYGPNITAPTQYGYAPQLPQQYPYFEEPRSRRSSRSRSRKRRSRSRRRDDSDEYDEYDDAQAPRSVHVPPAPLTASRGRSEARAHVHTPYPNPTTHGHLPPLSAAAAPSHVSQQSAYAPHPSGIGHVHVNAPPGSTGLFSPLTNPLPIPPRDLYELDAYKDVLGFDRNKDLVTSSSTTPKKSGAGGLFRSKSKSAKSEDGNHDKKSVILVPVYREGRIPPLVAGGAGDASRSVPTPSHLHTTAPPPPPPPRKRILLFTQKSKTFSGWMNHSPHRIMYQNLTYPSATHLFEALKFLPPSANDPGNHAPFPLLANWQPRSDVAAQIRLTPSASQAYALAAGCSEGVRPDWHNVYLRLMREIVLLVKFKQHPKLRGPLLATGAGGEGDAEIGYVDPEDEFWSLGNPLNLESSQILQNIQVGADGDLDALGPSLERGWSGRNELGKALVWVREKLRAEGYT